MPCAIFDYIGAFLRNGFAHVDNVIPVIKTIIRLLLSRLQGNKPHRNSPEPEPCLRNLRNSSEPSGTFRTLPPEPTPTRAGTLPPEPSKTFRNQPFGTFRNVLPREPTPAYTRTPRNLPEPSGNLPPEPIPFYTRTLRNLPRPASGTYTSIRRNPPEPSGNRLRNLHQHTPELSGTFRNLPPELAPATRTRTHRSLSGLKAPLAYAVGEISFGGIPNSSSLLTTWAHSCSAVVLPMRTMLSPKGVQKQSHGCSCQGRKATNHS